MFSTEPAEGAPSSTEALFHATRGNARRSPRIAIRYPPNTPQETTPPQSHYFPHTAQKQIHGGLTSPPLQTASQPMPRRAER
jgi:hypothetical protein